LNKLPVLFKDDIDYLDDHRHGYAVEFGKDTQNFLRCTVREAQAQRFGYQKLVARLA
jgi:hypothetical protein